MLNRSLRASLSVLLAFAIAVWTLAPPAYQHSHEGGTNLSHHHHNGDTDHDSFIAEEHGPHHADDDEDSPLLTEVVQALGGGGSHLHFEWLGIHLTLPAGQAPNNSDDDDGAPKLLVMGSGQALRLQFQSVNKLAQPPFSFGCALPAAHFIGDGLAKRYSQPPDVTHSLCDRARHERSGVQLA